MKEDQSTAPPALRALCQQAGRQAAGWQPDAGPGGTARAASRGLSTHKPLLKLGLIGASSLLTVAVVAAQFLTETASPKVSVKAIAAMPTRAAASPFVAPPAATPAESVRWQGNELLVDFEQVPLAQAVTSLARATQTAVNGLQLLQQPVTVTLHVRTGDVAAAWQHLLRSHAAFSIACSASNCGVWIGSEIGAPTAAATPGAEQAPPDDRTSEEKISQPDGSC